MTHDPLCPYADRVEDEALRDVPCGICELIAKVCQDERDGIDAVRLRTAFNEQGYRDGQRDMLARCIAAVEEKDAAGTAQGWDLHISDVLAALRALQETS